MSNVGRYLGDIKKYENLSLVHVNITSMNSNFEKRHDLLLNYSNSFNTIKSVLLRHGPQIRTLRIIQISIYQTLTLYIKNEKLKIIIGLSVSDGDNKCVSVEIENKNSKNLLITCCCRPPNGTINGLNSYFKKCF